MIYMFKNKLFILFVVGFILGGCGYKQTNTQIRDIAYLKFNKSSSKNYTAVINNKYKIKLDKTTNKLYEIKSGKVALKIYDENNNLIMKKEFYIGSSNTMEVNLQ